MKKLFILFTLIIPIITGCAEPYNPYKIPREELFSKVKTIGIAPLLILVDVNQPQEKKQSFETMIASKVSECGFKTVPSSEYEKIYEDLKKTIGPMFDPNTGELDKDKSKALKDHTIREYLRKNQVDAILYPSILIVKAEWNGNYAGWHGQKEPSTGKEGFFASMLAPNAYGFIPALSLCIQIESVNGEPYYLNFGGIQLYSWVKGGSFIDVPKELLLSHPERNTQGVDIAFRPILTKEKPK
jgi:hypothetical protein